ncbi:MAG: HAD-IA family hydrolase [Bacteroidales bacterium]|nr:HAD-IA family hydrolase [Bacteroidales bacterium]
MKHYTDFVFDIDGTLLDTERTGVLSLMQTVRELLDRKMTYGEAYGFFGIPSAKVSAMLGYADKDRFGVLWEEHFQELMYLVKPFPGVEDVLRDLRTAGFRTGVVTSRSRTEIAYDPHLAQLLPYFDLVIGSEQSARHKPFPDPMLAYLEGTGAEAAATLYLGDTMHDWRCGHDAGCDFALADWRERGWQGIAAEYRFTDAPSLREILGI